MRAGIANVWERTVSGLWFIPGLLMAVAIALGLALPAVDANVDLDLISDLLFGGTADSARTVVSTIATAVVTVVAVGFSVTIVAIQQAANQYNPRVLGNFMRNRGNQVVLGAYLATFAYSVLVLRQVREETPGQEGFVPGLSVTMAVVFALISVALFIFFMQHIAQQLQASTILRGIKGDLMRSIRRIFPEEFGAEAPPIDVNILSAEARARGGRHEQTVEADNSGYIRRVDEHDLLSAGQSAALVYVTHAVGDFVVAGSTLVVLWSREPLDDPTKTALRHCFVLGSDRTVVQDLRFGLQQMTDIAVKALSPGINDPSTAAQAMDNLGAVLVRLAGRQFPNPVRRSDDDVTYLFTVPSFRDYIRAAFHDIHHFGRNNPSTLSYLVQTLDRVGEHVPDLARAEAVREQLDRIGDDLADGSFSASDKAALKRQVSAVVDKLRTKERLSGRADVRKAS